MTLKEKVVDFQCNNDDCESWKWDMYKVDDVRETIIEYKTLLFQHSSCIDRLTKHSVNCEYVLRFKEERQSLSYITWEMWLVREVFGDEFV